VQGLVAAGAARLASQIEACTYIRKTRFTQELRDGDSLVVAMFQQQPAARRQVSRGGADDGPQVVQAVGTGGQGLAGLVSQGGHVRVVLGDVGGVAHDEVELFGRVFFA